MNKFRKDKYEISVYGENGEIVRDSRDGYISPKAMFGITKVGDKYRVTHLPSGMSIKAADRGKLRDVKEVVLKAEDAFNWDESDMYKIAALNGVSVRELRDVFSLYYVV